MAVVALTRNRNLERRVLIWTGAVTGDTFAATDVHTGPIYLASVHISGTFAGGTLVTLEASNTGTNYITLKDVNDTAISMTAEGLVEFSTTSLFVRPTISGGAADSITVTIVAKG